MKKCFLCYIFFAFLFTASQHAIPGSLEEQIENVSLWPPAVTSWHTRIIKRNLKKSLYDHDKVIPLFKYLPQLYKKLPHVSLGSFPTPVQKLEQLGALLNTQNLYLKNDGLSGNLFGGNKVRKLEFLLAEALEQKAPAVVTIGAAGSNHAAATAIYANHLGLKSHSLLVPQLNTSYLRRNLLLTYASGGDIQAFPSKEAFSNGLIALFKKYKENYNSYPFFIPLGGSCTLAEFGFINAAFELKEQIAQGLLPEPDYIYLTWGSGGSVVGLALGLKLAGLKSKIVAVTECGIAAQREEFTFTLAQETTELIKALIPSLASLSLTPQDLTFNHNWIGKYAEINASVAASIKMMYDAEGIKLDGTYTGKTLSALIQDFQDNAELKNKIVLFWNTFSAGSFSERIQNIDYKNLPSEVHSYFENAVQELDQGV